MTVFRDDARSMKKHHKKRRSARPIRGFVKGSSFCRSRVRKSCCLKTSELSPDDLASSRRRTRGVSPASRPRGRNAHRRRTALVGRGEVVPRRALAAAHGKHSVLGDLLHAEGVLHARHLARVHFGLVRVRADGHSSGELGNRCGSGEEADGKGAEDASTEHAREVPRRAFDLNLKTVVVETRSPSRPTKKSASGSTMSRTGRHSPSRAACDSPRRPPWRRCRPG
jgi:hypothetical protein